MNMWVNKKGSGREGIGKQYKIKKESGRKGI